MPFYRCQLTTTSTDYSPTIKQLSSWINNIEGIKISRANTQNHHNSVQTNLLCQTNLSASEFDESIHKILSNHDVTLSHAIEFEDMQIDENAHVHSHNCCDHGHDHDDENTDNHWLKAAIGLLYGIGLLGLSIFSGGLPIAASIAINIISTALTLYLGANVYKSAWQALLDKRLTSATLYSISTLTITLTSILSLLIPGLPLMVEAAPLVLGFWHLGEGIEHSLVDKLSHGLNILDCLPKQVQINHGQTPIELLLPNDVFSLESNDVIPVDGILLEDAWLYTTRIDGSPDLKHMKAGSSVKSGMRLADDAASINIQVTHTLPQSYLSLVAKNIAKANQEKAPIAEFAETLLKYFIPGLITVAVVSAVVISSIYSPILALQCVSAILVSACPCVLSLITPMAVKIGMQKAAEHGVHFKNGKALQALADTDTFVFDVNGTWTIGKPSVSAFNVIEPKYLAYIAELEQRSKHPVAKVIRQYIEKKYPMLDDIIEITELDTNHHAGLKANIEGQTFIIGNKKMMAANGITQFAPPFDDASKGQIYVAYGQKLVGQISVTDPLRKDTAATIAKLQALGISVHGLTGADEQTAQAYAKKVNVPSENICASAVGTSSSLDGTAISKQQYIQQLQASGHKVAMVGDAANDAEAIARANIGIAVKSTIGDPSVEASAGMVIQEGELLPLLSALEVARHTKNNIYQNLTISLGYNTIITLIASGAFIGLGLLLNPALGVALMVLESSIVLANLYLLKRKMIDTSDPTPPDVPPSGLKHSSKIDLNQTSTGKHKTAHPKDCSCTRHNFFQPFNTPENGLYAMECNVSVNSPF